MIDIELKTESDQDFHASEKSFNWNVTSFEEYELKI